MKTIALDFDRCMHPYRNGWRGVVPEDEPPTEGCLEFMKQAKADGWRIAIVSSRALDVGGTEAINAWCDRYGLLDYVDEVTDRKVAAVAYIDDRGLTFIGDWDAMWAKVLHLHAHGPWHPDDVVEAHVYPADDEVVWLDASDLTVHKPLIYLNGTNDPHTTGHKGAPVPYGALGPAATLCPECF